MNNMKEFRLVAETIGSIQRLNQLGEREFARVFYGLKDSNTNREYVRQKYHKYCEEGFLSAYNRLDIGNTIRVLEYITDDIYKYVETDDDYEEQLGKAEESYDRLCLEMDEGGPIYD